MHIESYDGLLCGRQSYSNLIPEFSRVLANFFFDFVQVRLGAHHPM